MGAEKVYYRPNADGTVAEIRKKSETWPTAYIIAAAEVPSDELLDKWYDDQGYDFTADEADAMTKVIRALFNHLGMKEKK